jgi:hypothetical protein
MIWTSIIPYISVKMIYLIIYTSIYIIESAPYYDPHDAFPLLNDTSTCSLLKISLNLLSCLINVVINILYISMNPLFVFIPLYCSLFIYIISKDVYDYIYSGGNKPIVKCKNEIVNNDLNHHIEKSDQCLPITKKYTCTIKNYDGVMIYDNVYSWVSQNIDCDIQSTIFNFGTSGIPSLLFELKSNLEKEGYEVVISLIVFPSTHARLEVKKM